MIIFPKTNFNFATRFVLQLSENQTSNFKAQIHTSKNTRIFNTSWKRNVRNREIRMWNAKREEKNEKNRGFATYVETRKDRSVDWNVRKIYSSLDTHSRADRSRSPQHLPEGCIVMHFSTDLFWLRFRCKPRMHNGGYGAELLNIPPFFDLSSLLRAVQMIIEYRSARRYSSPSIYDVKWCSRKLF